VNYEIPNGPEDYVHRIGRTGRAGAEGQAVSFVCLDEEGFMQEIERFTKQRIPVQAIEGFGPEPSERAEPIAMGRQTIWGGAGKPPSREIMAAAAKAARQEMMQRIRENKGAQGAKKERQPQPQPQQAERSVNGNRNGNRNGNGQRPQQPKPRNGNGTGNRNGQHQQQHAQHREREDRDDDRLPSNIDPLRTNLPTRRDMTGVKRVNGTGQPDPTRTSIDTLGASRRQRTNAFRGSR
jgi:ATP-dependent RNA helicase RhlE